MSQLAGLLGPAGLGRSAAKALGLPPLAALLSIPQPAAASPPVHRKKALPIKQKGFFAFL
ncbi:hypothetical protein SGRA_0861 [Saprospira grandis str. Lewin]|uniref:Uncharacterized protein n=1 Tax=Saprospira grandis (strain Lewin) TaxID=984262 RepID=H6L2D9_SAPGL|nr:hypothetical protein SGRA_0861 [Saprospira grandis str. Lewin]